MAWYLGAQNDTSPRDISGAGVYSRTCTIAVVTARGTPVPCERRTPRAALTARACAVLGPRADVVPTIADRVFEALPGVGMARFPVAAGLRFQGRPITPPVALVRP